MSAELPQLERLIADAAERHYGGRRRFRVPAPRLSLVAGLVAAAAAVVLAIAILPLDSDEQSAAPPGNPAKALAGRYSVFAGEHTPSRLESQAVQDMDGSLDTRQPVATRLLRRFHDGGFVVVAGTTKGGAEALCVWEQETSGGSAGCQDLADVPTTAPWFAYGNGIGPDTDQIVALVPDAVVYMKMTLKDGSSRIVPVRNNLAYIHAGLPICSVTWTFADGRTGHERGPTRAEEATPDDPNPAVCD
ncbi:MAG TPA: hypothetical protein VFX51_13645 [Solirubrobacteraceae bacterium]|nr:hypothetical protein [Solirubrobacteraceae bacterium]